MAVDFKQNQNAYSMTFFKRLQTKWMDPMHTLPFQLKDMPFSLQPVVQAVYGIKSHVYLENPTVGKPP
jgi:hypothetical protein